MVKEHMQEAALVDLSDSDLKELLGHCYHSAKNLEERKKEDPFIVDLRERLKLYVDSTYTEEIRFFRARLKAARRIAAARGIEWHPPKLEQSP